ncbi:uncharacterized protein VP01_3685g2 [Puccinia sorghi]|uniref:Retrovirus-related Pol polyprotein from transposon TNT 1-94-like beta-barrel domain-containing protein n=1 Tax=Puccinia sorghi TaxID=27349 RepID=A0A0L6UUA3_9BASI|nr:uncharacterized protein VP01_3685g2 [Puccinia sorghi]
MSDGKNLPVLTSSNFTSWKIRVQGYCMQHGLYKFLTNNIPPAEPAKKEDWDEKRSCVTGILYQFIGETNHQRFVTSKNAKDPCKIWTALIRYYKLNSIQNQSIVYQEFLALTYRNSVGTFLDKLDARLSSMAAVGLVVGTPEKANIKESLLAESILAKLPSKFASIKEILCQKCPLTIAMIRESLDSKCCEVAAPSSATPTIKQESALKAKGTSSKQTTRKDYPQCAPGWHNPATTGHTKQDCCMKRCSKPQAKAAASSQPDSDSESLSIATAANGFVCIRKALLAIFNKDTCFLDSCASHHMFSERSKFSHYNPWKSLIELADGNTLESVGEGYVHLLANDKSTIQIKVLHVPALAGTLISFRRFFV